ncbi:MAG: phospho-N-acetylmuramoyl-pentapeptide-transferase [Streptosporangiales bacterium]|nr:phospho-N-acetylmuramoyl-pentapeptide-transferase [Streptosporangiales bacterium]MBO0891921.1 phospho-N-acetylmuramoyl-pentapeptide-transferase [Acidothermales bacterium]
MRLVLFSGAIALFVALLGTPVAISLFRRHGYGQEIRDEGPTSHQTKRGTPTMGGTVIIVAALLGYIMSHLVTMTQPTVSGGLALGLMTALGIVGFLDDVIKIWKQRSLGLRSGAKSLGQGVVAIAFAIAALRFPNAHSLTPASAYLSLDRDIYWLYLGPIAFVVIALIMVAGASNAVNLTDGLDGLATGASVMVFASYVVIGNWQFRNSCTTSITHSCYWVRDPLDLAVVAAAMAGACFGFLWWNAPPARIFMGDTGSLALGGAMAAIAILTRTELLLLLLGGLFVIITLSVIIQVGFFKLTHRRVFRMAPLQHHFELVGWNEVTIVVRFWIVTGLCVAGGVGLFYGRWLS